MLARDTSQAAGWESDHADGPGANAWEDSGESLCRQHKENTRSHRSKREKLGTEPDSGLEYVREKLERNLDFLDRTRFDFEDEDDLGDRNISSTSPRGRDVPTRQRSSSGHLSDNADEHGAGADWEGFGVARPLVVDRAEEARILGLLQDSVKPKRCGRKGEPFGRATFVSAGIRDVQERDEGRGVSNDLSLASISSSSSLLFDRRRGEYFSETCESAAGRGEREGVASKRGAANHKRATERFGASVGDG